MAWFLVFAVTVFALWFWREYRVQQRHLESASAPHRTGERFIGQIVTVPQGVLNGTGRVQLGSRQWSLRGPDIPAGGKARITGVDGRVLIVDRMASH
jgi:membrane protein implicated in regulation of membrane protease activity